MSDESYWQSDVLNERDWTRHRSKPMSIRLTFLFASFVLLSAILPASAEGVMRSDEELIKILKTAAPAAIVEHATIMNMGADGKMKTIQEGTNGWTCMDPGSHGNGEPMCADKAVMDWAGTWQNKQPPQLQLASSTCSMGIAASVTPTPTTRISNLQRQITGCKPART